MAILAGCSGNAPLTVREIEQTKTVLGTKAVESATATAQSFQNMVKSRAPEGAVITDPAPLRDHDQNLQLPFGELPPTGGVHNPAWQNCDVYDKPITPQNALHSLEHGAVWITYQLDLAEESVTALQKVGRSDGYLLMSPYPNQRSPIVLTAWGVQLEVQSADDPRIDQFVRAYLQGPQTPEPGALCTGGVRTTVEGY